jgi:enoyl-CoA hydratase/carnithine racemase
MAYSMIGVEEQGAVVNITLRREPLNVLNIAMMKEINACLDSLKGRDDLAVLVFQGRRQGVFRRRGRGRAFGGSGQVK